ncbi:hypothetical protein [Campylobacter sp. 19-13652]|uniref:hypothetical protein n=1 Tax=Campylobacter sp. 19-13652 TaxID=2840180 RepID=UPI001C743769|nr:hypothetical protein [Campylobacter sp. 19-13652]BCX79043.1 hypothetical protein LBC_05050 [Campylobacter sp. 19-13652]
MRRIKREILSKDTSLDNLTYQFITKPRFGSGSRDVVTIFSVDDFKQALKNIDILNEDFLIKELALGTKYGLSGNRAKWNLSSHTNAQKSAHAISISLVRGKHKHSKNPRSNKIYVVRCRCFKFKNSPINTDLTIDENGTPFIIEIALRPSGQCLSKNFVTLTTGVNIAKERVKLALGQEFSFKPKFYKQDIIKRWRYVAPDFKALERELGTIDYD